MGVRGLVRGGGWGGGEAGCSRAAAGGGGGEAGCGGPRLGARGARGLAFPGRPRLLERREGLALGVSGGQSGRRRRGACLGLGVGSMGEGPW